MILYRIALDPDNSRTKGCKSAVGLRQDLAASLGGDGFTIYKKSQLLAIYICNWGLSIGVHSCVALFFAQQWHNCKKDYLRCM